MLNVSYIVNSIFTSRTYILSDEYHSEYWLVDCGDIQPLQEAIASKRSGSFLIKGVLLTHAHYDHIYGLSHLTDIFPDVKVYTNEIGKRALSNSRLNMSKYHEDPIIYESDNVMVCKEGDVIELFDGIQAIVYETPGHHPSCLTFEVGDYLFTGDAYIPGVKVVTILPGADKELAKESLERIINLAEGKTVLSGHETETSNNE